MLELKWSSGMEEKQEEPKVEKVTLKNIEETKSQTLVDKIMSKILEIK